MMAKTYDYHYQYPEFPVPCRIRVYQAGGQTVCLATQRQDKFGESAITDHAVRIATQVAEWHHPVHDGQLLWVEHYEYPLGPGPQGAWETFAFVAFQRDADGGFCRPEWRPTDRAAVEAAVGAAVET